MVKRTKKLIIIVLALVVFMGLSNYIYADSRVNMTYLYRGTTKDYKTYIDKTNDSVDVILPNLFNIKWKNRNNRCY